MESRPSGAKCPCSSAPVLFPSRHPVGVRRRSPKGHRETALSFAVLGVVARCSNEQMRRVHADRVVTPVTDEHTVWDGPSVCQRPRHSMGAGIQSRMFKPAIAGRRDCASPRPALIAGGRNELGKESGSIALGHVALSHSVIILPCVVWL